VKSYVRNTIKLSCAKILLTSVIFVSAFVISGSATTRQYFGFLQITDKLLLFLSASY